MLEIRSTAYKSVVRIGRVDPTKKRPIKVAMENEEDKNKIISNLRNLKGRAKRLVLPMTTPMHTKRLVLPMTTPMHTKRLVLPMTTPMHTKRLVLPMTTPMHTKRLVLPMTTPMHNQKVSVIDDYTNAYQKVSVTDDYTIAERQSIKEYSDKAKDNNAKEPVDSRFVWRVRGNPKNGLIIKKFLKYRPMVHHQVEQNISN